MQRYSVELGSRNHVDVINVVAPIVQPALLLATRNPNKLAETERILGYPIKGLDLEISEIQADNMDPQKVVERKAIDGWTINHNSPVIVEDTSLEIAGLNGRPGIYVDAFTKTVADRQNLLDALKGKDRRVTARIYYAVFDGIQIQLAEGECHGLIAEELAGAGGFGWDDMFIPDGQPNGERKTFAEMTSEEKDEYSMRAKALLKLREKPFRLKKPVFLISEPVPSEIEQIRFEELQQEKAVNFAFSLESIRAGGNKPNAKFQALGYTPLHEERRGHSRIFTSDPDSASYPLIIAPEYMRRIEVGLNEEREEDREPVLYQMGPEMRKSVLAQRAEFFLLHQSPERQAILDKFETGEISVFPRSNKRHPAVEKALGMKNGQVATRTATFAELGYVGRSSSTEQSRKKASQHGLIHKIGRYPRQVLGVGSLPMISGRRDVITTAVIAGMPVFIGRNGPLMDPERRIRLAQQAIADLEQVIKDENDFQRAVRNIGIAIGTDDPQREAGLFHQFQQETGLDLCRIYTINSDPRVNETAERIRGYDNGHDAEIFIGQIVDVEQASKLKDFADALLFGHGGGRLCDSGRPGMTINTLELIYSIVRDSEFNDISILVEGGVDRKMGPLLILGVDGILYNNQFGRGTIEVGDVFVKEEKTGKLVTPYPGSASAVQARIEAEFYPEIVNRRIRASGRTINPEGKLGFMYFERKAGTMTFRVTEFLEDAARVLVDLGVKNMTELRNLLAQDETEYLRWESPDAQRLATAYRT